ncbi:hypothetical protein GCM10023160_07920 [Brachybacterium paraconglomeratum]|uniref:proline-rich domain-containing protein n=1 Tax=Brachybacterium paraconglomeratum TaxID=173362 RepID=UPI0031E61E9E
MTVPGGGHYPSQDPHSQDPQQFNAGPPQEPQQAGGQYQSQHQHQPQLQYGSPAPQYGSPHSAPQHGSPAPQGAPVGPGSPAPQGYAPAPVAATGMTPEQLKQKLGAAGLTNPLPSLAVGGVTYLGGILVSVLAIVLLAIAAAIAGMGNPVEATLEGMDIQPDQALSGIASALRFPFQLVAMAMLGSLGFSKTFDGESVSASIRLLPGVITVVMALLSFYGGRFVQRRQAAGQLGIWVSAVLTGFVVALVTVLAALIFAQPIPVDEDVTLRLHAAGFDTFFGAFLLLTLAHALGRISLRSRPSWWPLVTDLTAGFKLALTHALLITVLAFAGITVATTIQALIDGETPPMLYVILLLPLLGGYVLSYLTGMDLLSSLSASITGPGLLDEFGITGSEFFSVFSMPWYAWLGALVLIPIGLLVAALLWQHQRQVVPSNVVALAVSWAALPVVYFVSALGLLILARFSASVGYSGTFGDGEVIGASLGLAAWTPLLAGIAGVIVELLSRFVTPLAAPFIPAKVLSWFRRPLAPALAGTATAAFAAGTAGGPADAASADAASAPNAQGIPTELAGATLQPDPPQVGAPDTAATAQSTTGSPYATVALGGGTAAAAAAAPGQEQAPATPLSPKARKLLVGGGIAVGGAFVLLVGIAIAFNIISSTVFSPEKRVEAYLSALQEGDAAQAVEISAPNAPTAQQVLLTNAIAGSAENRISSYEILDSEESGDDEVLVTATVVQDGVSTTRNFFVERSGRTALVFPEWRMGETEYAYLALEIPEGASTLLVNGQEVAVESLAVDGGYAVAAVLPGQYTVSLPEVSEFISSEQSAVFVPADPEGWYELYAAPIYTLSEAGTAEVQSQVKAALDECAKSTEASPEDCPFSAWASSMVEGSGSWTIDTYPTVELEPTSEGWSLSSYDSPGEATFSYQQESWNEEDAPTDETDTSTLRVSGTATLGEDGTLTVDLSEDGW